MAGAGAGGNKKGGLLLKQFKHMSALIYRLFKEFKLERMYEQFWNPINYAIVGGIGVVVNYLVFTVLIGFLPWYLTNIVAILSAWLWNWSNSVGRLGYLWGFGVSNKQQSFEGDKTGTK